MIKRDHFLYRPFFCPCLDLGMREKTRKDKTIVLQMVADFDSSQMQQIFIYITQKLIFILGMTFDHDFGYSFPLYLPSWKKREEEKENEYKKLWWNRKVWLLITIFATSFSFYLSSLCLSTRFYLRLRLG